MNRPLSVPSDAVTNRRGGAIVATCAIVALVENFDIAVMGLIGPQLMPDLAISRAGFGLAISALMFGYLLGAPTGGLLGQRYGERSVMLAALTGVGLSCLLTALATSLPPLIALRFSTGFFIAVAFPNALMIAVKAMGKGRQSRAIALTTIGGAAGGIAAGLLAAVGGDDLPWRVLFVVAGVATLLLLVLVVLNIPRDQGRPSTAAPVERAPGILFGGGRAWATFFLWLACFFTAYANHVVMGWLPTIVAERGGGMVLAGSANMLLNAAAIAGGFFLSGVVDNGRQRTTFLATYAGACVGLGLLALAQGATSVLLAAVLTGLFLLGGQIILYSAPTMIYPPEGRAWGIGWSLGVGRWGAIAGPTLAGFALSEGAPGTTVLMSTVPAAGLAGLAIVLSLTLAGRQDRGAGALMDGRAA